MEKYINIVDYHQRINNDHIIFDRHVENLSRCSMPWKNLVINQFGETYICSSPAWLPKSIGSVLDYPDLFSLLNSYEARSIRSEIIRNRYSYCNNKICQHFNGFSTHQTKYQTLPASAADLVLLTEDQFAPDSVVDNLPPQVCFDFDYTCNFKCPSCRTEMINHNRGPMFENNKLLVEKIKHMIIDKYTETNSPLYIRWAGGEPFISKVYLDIWKYIVKKNNHNIKNVIQTNGSYLKRRDKLLKEFIAYISELRISFDAGTADTYAKIRLNGDWDTLIDNCKYIRDLANSSQSKIKLQSDFIIQLDNFREIPQYIDTALSLGFDTINVSKMWNWGTWSSEEFQEKNVSDPTHPLYGELIVILNRYQNDTRIRQLVDRPKK